MIPASEIWRRIKVFFIKKNCFCCDLPLNKSPPRKIPKYLILCCGCRIGVHLMIMQKEVYKELRYDIAFRGYSIVRKQIEIAEKFRKINQRLRQFQDDNKEKSLGF